MTYRFRFSAFQSLVSVLPKPLYLFVMLRFVGIKVFDKVCLVSPFLVLPCKFAQQHILLLDGMQLGIVVGTWLHEINDVVLQSTLGNNPICD